MELQWTRTLPSGVEVHARATSRLDGDLSVQQEFAVVDARRRNIIDRPWTWLRQVHGRVVAQVDQPGQHAGLEADAAVTRNTEAVLVAHTADCAPVGFFSDNGVIGTAHAGWRGLVDGVIEATVDKMAEAGAQSISAVLGPCIHTECYEFGAEDLARVVHRFGRGVAGETAAGTPALDMQAAVRAALEQRGVPLVAELGGCTACGTDHFWSHRARAEPQRQALALWLQDPAPAANTAEVAHG